MASPPACAPARDGITANLVRLTMNKFLKRKGPEPLNTNDAALHALSAAPQVQTSPTIKKSGTGRWRKSRKAVDERPEVNLDLALPSNDDFRTSLFMPALSARFSMLREQDDPTSKLGKASDDSVLQPRRRSRMDHLALDDIAEVEVASAQSSIRPPFAGHRQHSFASEDSYGSERDSSYSGSVMNRARPGEGNTMFGGRQRVYMIPKSGAASSRSLGRVVYEDDLGTSLFQQYRRQRNEAAVRESNGSHGFDFGLDQIEPADPDDGDAPFPNDSARDLSHSPSWSSSRQKRSTDSGSHSEARSSTAATSVASQPVTTTASPVKPAAQVQQPQQPVAPSPAPPLKRADTKTRRLYEQGLDQHMQEQQSSALNRLNSIHRQRTLSNKQPQMYAHTSKSAGNLHDRFRQPVHALSLQDSPTTTTPLSTAFGAGGLSNSNGPSPMASAPGTPVTPQAGGDFDENFALLQALEPGDRGKATAMGAFNKPKQSFDEQQYMERQRQLQRSASIAAVRKDSGTHGVLPAQHDSSQKPRALESNSPTAPPLRNVLKGNESARAPSPLQRPVAQAPGANAASRAEEVSSPDPQRTFFGNLSGSESEGDDDSQPPPNPSAPLNPDRSYGTQLRKQPAPTVLPAVSEHPALRAQNPRIELADAAGRMRTPVMQPSSPAGLASSEPTRTQTSKDEIERPLVADNAPSGSLNGVMKHLRQTSNVSSITQRSDAASIVETPGATELTATNLDLVNRPVQTIASPESRVGSYAVSNPWDLDEVDATARQEQRVSRASVSPIDGAGHLVARLEPSNTSLLHTRDSAVSALEPERETQDAAPEDSQSQHNRDTSTATQQDREAFDNELAARRQAIQENIRKSKAERENQSRGVSPAPSASSGHKALQKLRSKASRESIEDVRAAEPLPNIPSKAFKLLGAEVAGAVGSHTDTPTPTQDFSRPREQSASRPSVRSDHFGASQRGEQENVRQVLQSRSRQNSETNPLPPRNRSQPSAGERSRANSATTNARGRSRTGPYRDDLEKAMAEGTGSSTTSVPDLGMPGPRELTPRLTPDVYQNSFEQPHVQSGSRTAMTHYFDLPATHSNSIGSTERSMTGQPSPASAASPFSPAVTMAPRSPAGSFPQNMTPPLSGSTTPLQSSHAAPPSMSHPVGRPGGALRKKTISKSDISEPTLLSSTSNVELIDLPEGASLKNGMDEPPPLPPINPARRATKKIMGMGRKESQDSTISLGRRSKTPEATSRKSPDPEPTFDMPHAYRSRSATLSPQKPSSSQGFDPGAPRGFRAASASPEESGRASPLASAALDGAMF